jgi:hypothetical protein
MWIRDPDGYVAVIPALLNCRATVYIRGDALSERCHRPLTTYRFSTFDSNRHAEMPIESPSPPSKGVFSACPYQPS